jgi:hypothetical protein
MKARMSSEERALKIRQSPYSKKLASNFAGGALAVRPNDVRFHPVAELTAEDDQVGGECVERKAAGPRRVSDIIAPRKQSNPRPDAKRDQLRFQPLPGLTPIPYEVVAAHLNSHRREAPEPSPVELERQALEQIKQR